MVIHKETLRTATPSRITASAAPTSNKAPAINKSSAVARKSRNTTVIPPALRPDTKHDILRRPLPIMNRFIPKYSAEIQQMMFVAGETQDLSVETLTLVEKIIHEQVVHVLTTAKDLATRRGDKLFSAPDILFQVRHEPSRQRRLQKLLLDRAIIKHARKTTNNDDEGDLIDVAEDEVENIAVEEASKKNTKPLTALLPWDVENMFEVQPPGREDDIDLDSEEFRERLHWADEMTKKMTKDEYTRYAECRNASFVKRKDKRFREWAGQDATAGLRKSSDTIELIAFLAVEMVQRLTDIALSIQEEDLKAAQASAVVQESADETVASLTARGEGPFVQPTPKRPAISVEHIRRAFDRTQVPTKKQKGYRLTELRGPAPLKLI
ncbi:hypothetical protein F53441_9446 [Fusarium austroafricanum]|uniref:Uncharacterized protein n=1 Tax=Fusarium austroafricanum TaxID=2364996 RepID=A0A8H4KB15_9HYPO|nr:hypothetical protein F53441_9446 [Fusarium austroafricanum]